MKKIIVPLMVMAAVLTIFSCGGKSVTKEKWNAAFEKLDLRGAQAAGFVSKNDKAVLISSDMSLYYNYNIEDDGSVSDVEKNEVPEEYKQNFVLTKDWSYSYLNDYKKVTGDDRFIPGITCEIPVSGGGSKFAIGSLKDGKSKPEVEGDVDWEEALVGNESEEYVYVIFEEYRQKIKDQYDIAEKNGKECIIKLYFPFDEYMSGEGTAVSSSLKIDGDYVLEEFKIDFSKNFDEVREIACTQYFYISGENSSELKASFMTMNLSYDSLAKPAWFPKDDEFSFEPEGD